MALERLQRYLARAGVASRRAAEELIRAGLVAVNGRPVTTLGTKVDPLRDEVTLEGRKIVPPAGFVYLALHKPLGYVTTMHDPQGRPTVADLLPSKFPRLFPVGRLDLDTTGLLLFTNDGDLAHALLHPSRGVWKTYRARVKGVPPPAVLARLQRGILLEDGLTAPAKVKIVGRHDGDAILEISLHEGRKRQVRRMLAAVGYPVVALSRIAFGPLRLGKLPPGAWRLLRPEEIAALRRAAGMATGEIDATQEIFAERPGDRSGNGELSRLRTGERHRPPRALGGRRAPADQRDPGHRGRSTPDDRSHPGGHSGRAAPAPRGDR